MNRYQDIKKNITTDGIVFNTTVLYPEVAATDTDYYVITSAGDRYDTLAQQFYGDHTLWWIIASSNNSERASLVVTPGVQIRIPSNKDIVIAAYRDLNK